MKEFGSDFHYIDISFKENHNKNIFEKYIFYACGRHPLLSILLNCNYKRIWLPEYYCYEVVDYLKINGIEIVFYVDFPLFDDMSILSRIEYEEGDVLLRINYFGLRTFRTNRNLGIPVIEDHSHDLLGEWACCSDADWCFSSLRKTLPIAEGGVLWSPKDHKLIDFPKSSSMNEILSEKRWEAMKMKTNYLKDGKNKSFFRRKFIETEELFKDLPISTIDSFSIQYVKNMDVEKWYEARKENWRRLYNNLIYKVRVLAPESMDLCFPFSLIICFEDEEKRNSVRERLIDLCIYPAILWKIPDGQNNRVQNISNRLLSINCDARYDSKDIELLSEKLKMII